MSTQERRVVTKPDGRTRTSVELWRGNQRLGAWTVANDEAAETIETMRTGPCWSCEAREADCLNMQALAVELGGDPWTAGCCTECHH